MTEAREAADTTRVVVEDETQSTSSGVHVEKEGDGGILTSLAHKLGFGKVRSLPSDTWL
jgi:hypothetical protein